MVWGLCAAECVARTYGILRIGKPKIDVLRLIPAAGAKQYLRVNIWLRYAICWQPEKKICAPPKAGADRARSGGVGAEIVLRSANPYIDI